MPVTLSIKNVSDEVAQRLKQRAARNRRSLQGELLTIVEDAAAAPPDSLREIGELARRLGLHAETGESARMVREDRDDPRR